MKRPPPRCLASLLTALLIGSCVGSDSPTGLGLAVAIPINPALIPSPADGSAAPINRIRARAVTVPGGTLIGENEIDVSPTADQWEVTLDVTFTGASVQAEIRVFLINVADGVERVEFSGLQTITVEQGGTANVADIAIVRGPIANHHVTGVTITSVPESLREGQTAVLRADVATSGEGDPQVYFTVLDSAILSSSDSVVTGLAPGVGRIVASAGRHADTASINVRPAPSAVLITPESTSVEGIGAQATYQAAVVDARGDTIPDEPLVWRSGTPSIITSLGDGLFEALAVGTGIVEATPASDPSVVGSAVMQVVGGPGGPDVLVIVSADDTTPAEGDTVQVFVEVGNNDVVGATDVTGIVVQNALSAGMTVLASSPGSGTFDVGTGEWTVGDLPIGTGTTLTLDIEIPVGSAGQTLTDSVWVVSLDQTQIDLSNDTAVVSFAIQVASLDVEVLKTVDDPQPLADSTVTFTVSVVNHGPGQATNIAVFDTLESAVFLSPMHTVSAGSLVDDSLWTIAALAEGDTARWMTTATVATAAAGGSATNTAFIRSLGQNDPVAANDTAVVSMTIPTSGVPDVQITSPVDGSVFDPGDVVSFTATAVDPEEGDLSAQLQWTSSIDGAIGTGAAFTTSTLSTGLHTIDAAVTDMDGGTGADTIRVTIALITTPTTLNVPFGGTASLPITLTEPAQPGGLTLDVSTADAMITQPSSSTVFIAEGTLSVNATLQGLEPGTTDVTVSHPQFGSSTTFVSVTADLNIVQGTLSVPEGFPQPIDVRLESAGTPIAAPSGGVGVTLTSADPTCVSAPASITIPGGLTQESASLAYGGSATLPCTAWVRASAPSLTTDSVRVTVNPMPPIFVSGTTVGAGLQYGNFVATLGTTQHGGVTVRIESRDPMTLLVSPNAATVGTAFIDVSVPAGQNRANYYVQGVEGAAGTVALVVSAPGFVTDSANVGVVQAAYDIGGLNTASQTTFSPDDPFTVRVGVPNGPQTGLSIVQAVRFGGTPLDVTVTSSDTGVGELVTLPDSASPVAVQIAPGAFSSPGSVAAGGVAFDPIAAGSTTVTAVIDGLIQTTNAVRAVPVSAPGISIGGTTVGAGLQYGNFAATLLASDHGGVDVVLKSDDPSVLRVSPNATTEGTDSIVVALANGQTRVNYYVHGVEGATGTVPLIISAPGFVTDSADVNVVQPGYEIVSLSTTTTTLSPDDPFSVRVGVPNGQQTGLSIVQAVRIGGTTLDVTLTSSNTAVGELVTLPDSASPVSVQVLPEAFSSPGSVATGGVAFNPNEGGSTTVTATIDGLIQTTNATRDVSVSAPGISVGGTTVGAGLQYGAFATTLGATEHGGVDVTLKSSDPSVLRVSLSPSIEGTDSVVMSLANGQNRVTYYVHGMEGATGTVPLIVSAPGFVTDSADINVVQTGYEIISLNTTSLTTFSPDDPFTVRVGVPNTQQTALSIVQAVRFGGTTLTATVTTSNTGVGILKTLTNSGPDVTVDIVPGAATSPGSLATGGVVFDPLGIGTTTVEATIPGPFTQTDNATRVVSVSAPTINLTSTTVGSGLQYGNFSAILGATEHGGVNVTIKSSNPSVMLVSNLSIEEGTDSIVVFVANGQNRANYYVHGVEGQTGVVTLTATANGFTDGSATVSVVQPALDIASLSTAYTADAADDPFYVRIGVPNINSTGLSIVQAVRIGGSSVTATITSSNPSAARLVTSTQTGGPIAIAIDPGEFWTPTTFANGGVAIDPLAAGATTVEGRIPGFITTTGGSRLVTINP